MVIQELMRTHPRDGTHPATERTLRSELERVLAGEAPIGFVRPEIIESWRQSAALGVQPERFDPPYDGDLDEDSSLLRAAKPLIDRLGADLALTEVSVVLSDERSRVVARRVPGRLEEGQLDDLTLSPGYHWAIEHTGTNGLSSALATRGAFLVQGGEHFADILTTMATAGAPILDPRTAQVLGALTLVCKAEAANPLLLPMASRAVREIGPRSLNGSAALDRLLEERFRNARRRTRGALAAVSPGGLLTNAAASRLLSPTDQPGLWDFVSRNLRSPADAQPVFTLADGTARGISLEAIFDGGDVAGVLVRLCTPDHEGQARRLTGSSGSSRPAFGWGSLTKAEQSVTELVADGLTNREVATRLFLSPHTVDSHLRHIFSKLAINSRVDLVRIVTARNIANRAPMSTADVA